MKVSLDSHIGNNWLHQVILNKQEVIMWLLLQAGANIEATNGEGLTPLMLAVTNYNVTMAKLLLDRGADLKSKDFGGDQTALGFALKSWRPLPGDEKMEAMETIIELFLEKCDNLDLEVKDREHRTPLFIAIQNRNEGAVKLMLKKDADIEAMDMETL
ncbi:hypothetical protein EYC84_007072 [Monilinia fructicola]|uniref:Uncharacterized protein n=1 Tax=Monilinia fructicola TaxID=38448 RepID=A0A5M9KAD8_MONFR|nr:hypothetical protein EYC84_007072 [Monilinia fructicola]